MKKDPKIFLKHILESIEAIESHARNISKENFLDNIKTQDAVVRRLEIIGEAAKNLPDSLKNKYSKIPWKKISSTRDILIHEYFGVNEKLVWRIVKNDIPKLKKQIARLLQEI